MFSLLPILQKAEDRKSPGDNWEVITRGERRGGFENISELPPARLVGGEGGGGNFKVGGKLWEMQ